MNHNSPNMDHHHHRQHHPPRQIYQLVQQQQQQPQPQRWTKREYNLLQGRLPPSPGPVSVAHSYPYTASMDSGLVASPTYQNFPNRRPPPPVPRSPSPEAPPPALPPRNYRESDGGSSTGNLQDTSLPPLSPSDKHRISTIPLGKQLEDPQVENTKRDFKSLMSQWENSSPREDKYAAELRKQAQKLTGQQQQQQQQQHSNATPMALLHSRTKISYATTYKREPMLPQEATSPSASTSSLASSQTSSSTSPTSSSSHFQTSSGNSAPYISNIKVSYGQAPTSAAQVPDRSVQSEDSRNRSSSELVSNSLPGMGPGTVGKSGRPSEHFLRDRSASDHDILSDRRHQPQETHFGASPEGAPIAITKWRHASGSSVVSSTAPPGSGVDTNFAHDASAEDGFAEESYIGHKNKSSRAIGTYQRSKSAAVLQGNNHTLEDDDQKLGQQNWNSESVLTQGQTIGAEPAQASAGNNSHNDKTEAVPELNTAASVPPVRPARPSTYGRHGNAGGAAPPPASTAQSSSVSTASTATAPPQGPSPSVFSAKPFTVEQPGWIARRDSPRRNPDSSDSNPSPMRGQWQGPGQPGSNSDHPSYRWPSDDNPRAPPAVIQSQYSPQRRVPPSDSSPSPQWSANGMNSYKQAPISSSPDNAYNRSGEPLSPSEEPPVALPPRDYIRRDSAPVKSVPSAVSPDSKLGVSTDTSRRRSDSSVNSTNRLDNGDVSASVHSRQPSQEELECDEKAKQLAQELSGKDQKLSEVLRLDSTKKRMQYMDGLFSGAMDGNGSQEKLAFNSESRSSVKLASPQHQKQNENSQKEIPEIKKRGSLPKEYWMSPSKAMLEMELRRNEDVGKDITKDINDSSTLMKQKEELMDKLHKKLEILKEAKLLLQKEIAENEELGKQVHHLVDTNGWLTQNEKDKFKTYIDDLEKIVRLLLNLSGQLARAENAVQALSPDADAKLRKMTVDKRERLSAKHEEAKLLKDDIDKRSEQLSQILQDRLNEAEFSDYTHYIKMKSKLTIDLQELDDKITLGGEQIVELKKSIPDHNEA
ncbi:unnamed protein product [Lymnaea stagnalis]|uniref:ASD2 domain-containing protein n=1 Tax=Lymnaea stagnalis TaxID=6523 RepID=A0AAV2H0U9_LYMST